MELKSETEELWLLQHPKWVRWLGWLGLPLLTMCGVYVLALPVIETNYELVLIASSLFLGGFPIYMCVQGYKVFPYLRADVEFEMNGFSIFWPNGSEKKYLWSEVSELNHYATVQVLELKNRSGIRILAANEQAHSYSKFVEIAVEKTGLKY